MNIKSKNTSSRSGKGGRNKKKRLLPHQEWSFKPRLENEAIVLHSILDIYSVEYFQTIVDDIRGLITQLVNDHGFTRGSERYGVIKNYTTSLIELREPTNPPWLATSEKYNIPSKLGVNFCQLLADYFRCTDASYLPKYVQVTLTILNIVRMVDGLSDAEFISITEKSKPIDGDLLREFSTYVEEQLIDHKYDPDSTHLNGYRFNLLKNGPNSVPKIESAYGEAVCLLKDKLFFPFRRVCSEMKADYLVSYLQALVSDPQAAEDQQDCYQGITKLRYLVPIPDSGFKTRIVAICDFWTQLILEPIRAHVQLVIERKFEKSDFRKDHNLGVDAMVKFQRRCLQGEYEGEHKLNIRSLKFYDISSWTDRFHRDLQKIVMRSLFSSRLEEAWSQLVVHCPWHVKGQVDTLKYGQGQGMGTNGSFDIATLTDHLFINFIYDKKSSLKGVFPQNRCYGKVGDDLWIYDPDGLIKEYYGKINLPINFSKSKEYTKSGSTAEFCSRTFLNGEDVSRISPKIISKSKDFRYIPTLLSICASRGIQLDSSSFTRLNNTVGNSKVTYFDKLQPWIISLFALGINEKSLARELTLEYLMLGNWVTDETINVLSDPSLLGRLAIAHYIVEVAESVKDIKVKAVETMKLQFSIQWNTWNQLSDTNYFMVDGQEAAKAFFKLDRVLLPKEIILLQRLNDQDRLIKQFSTDISMGMLELVGNGIDPIIKLSGLLHDISIKSVYDNGNINYDVKRVYATQFNIVKVLERLNEDFTVLCLDDREQVMNVKQVFVNDLPKQGWGSELPELTSNDS